MAPKNKFLKQQLIDAAVSIACEEGMNGITIRKIADRLGSSIAPIYGNYKDVEELKNDVVKKIFEIQRDILKENQTGNAFLDAGFSWALFARKYPLLFQDIILKSDLDDCWYTELKASSIAKMKTEPMLAQFNEEGLNEILLKMEAFQIGLSVLAGRTTHSGWLTDEKILALLRSTGIMVMEDVAKDKQKQGG